MQLFKDFKDTNIMLNLNIHLLQFFVKEVKDLVSLLQFDMSVTVFFNNVRKCTNEKINESSYSSHISQQSSKILSNSIFIPEEHDLYS